MGSGDSEKGWKSIRRVENCFVGKLTHTLFRSLSFLEVLLVLTWCKELKIYLVLKTLNTNPRRPNVGSVWILKSWVEDKIKARMTGSGTSFKRSAVCSLDGSRGRGVGSCAEKQGWCSPLPKQMSSFCCRNSCIPGTVRFPLEQGGRVHHGLKGGFSDEPAEDTVDLSS